MHIKKSVVCLNAGGAGDGGGYLKHAATAKASTNQVFECWAASNLSVCDIQRFMTKLCIGYIFNTCWPGRFVDLDF